MAYAPARSCNAALHEGMTDSSYKKYAPNRGGFPEPTSASVRRDMSGVWHGFSEKQPKALPDGTVHSTPNYVDVTPMDTENV